MSDQPRTAANQDSWTVLRLLTWTTDFFRQRGSDSPRLDAEVLLAHALRCARIELYTAFNSEPSGEQRQEFRELVRRRGEGVPVAYLVGYREFYSLRLAVSPAVLIPRPETEHLVTVALDYLASLESKAVSGERSGRPVRVVDVGTGSGAIAIAVAKHLPTAIAADCRITAIDLSADALQVARDNSETHGVNDRIEFLQGDLLEPLPAEPQFDLVLSNPPYVSQSEYDELSPSVRDHEPRGALLAGPTGTELIVRLIDQAADRLVSGGLLAIELSPMIAEACGERVRADARYHELKFVKDMGGHRRLITALRR